MLTNAKHRKTILLSLIAFLSIFGCEKLEKELSRAVESTDVQQSVLKNSLTTGLSSSADIIVTTTSDVVDFSGNIEELPGPDGVVSLREAIIAANYTPGPQTIDFNIPTSDIGFDGTVFTIKQDNLNQPGLDDDETTIDGSSQTLFSGDSNHFGPEIVIDGSLLMTEFISALGIGSNYNTVIGLVINNMPWGGIAITGNYNTISQCYIGTDETGSIARDNLIGIAVMGCSNNVILNNLISCNTLWGLQITESTANIVKGNFIGTDRTGTKALGNNLGIEVMGSSNNQILNNLLSSNTHPGLQISESTANIVKGNLIGTDRTGTKALGNEDWAVVISGGSNNVIGGTTLDARNIISGNAADALFIYSSNSNLILGNFIGTDITMENPIPNNVTSGGAGITISGNSQDNIVDRNIIAFNLRRGILFQTEETVSAFNNKFTKNLIYSNEGLGIDLGNDGVTENDPGDLDKGDNNLMNYPVLTEAKLTPGNLHVRGTIDTQDPKTVTIEFFANPVPNPGGDPSGYGEGAIYLGSAWPNPQGKINAILPTVRPGTLITATATDANGNTSEFSAYIEAW